MRTQEHRPTTRETTKSASTAGPESDRARSSRSNAARSPRTANDDPNRRFVCLAEIARRWRVHRSTARRILDRADVLPYALGGERGGTIRYDFAEILAFERKSRERSS